MDLNTTLRRSYDTEMLILRTLFALDPDTNMPISTNFVVTTDGIGGLVWVNPYTNLSTAGAGIGYLPSTINSLSSTVASLSTQVSSLTIGLSSLSTVLGLAYISSGIYDNQLTSTTVGLGTIGYVSTSQLVSSIVGLGTVNYVSSTQLASTTAWILDASRYVSTGALVSSVAGLLPLPQLVSTVDGLGTVGYLSTSQLVSTVVGLGTSGYLSTSQLVSTVEGISTTVFSTFFSTLVPEFISPTQLLSTVSSLGSYGYVSTSQLTSTVAWFQDVSRYVSTGALVSTTAGLSTNLQTTFFIDNAGTLNIYGGTTVISSIASVVFLSTFVLSSLTYEGSNGVYSPVRYPDATLGNNMFFSTAKLSLDKFSSYILASSRINLEFYPTFVFPRLNTGATTYMAINMSSMLAYGTGYLSNDIASSWVYAGTQTSGFGNVYQQPIHLQIPGSLIANNYVNEYYLVHNLPNSVTSNLTPGFTSGDIQVQFGSTNSVFLSIQNLP
jgi:hypothetical protein